MVSSNQRTDGIPSPHHLLTAVDAVQPLLQLSKRVALQALGALLWDGGQWLPKKRLGGLKEGLRGASGLVLRLRLRR